MHELFYVFITVFLAELGDKTQLTTLTFATRYGWKTAFTGSIVALALVNLLGAVLGQKIGGLIPEETMHRTAGVIFIIFGLLMLAGRM